VETEKSSFSKGSADVQPSVKNKEEGSLWLLGHFSCSSLWKLFL